MNPALDEGHVRLELGGAASGARIRHVAACPGISPPDCAENDIPIHFHEQGMVLSRVRFSSELGLGKGFQVGLELPLDFKVSTIRYELVDGSSYQPPYSGIHHRNETLVGLGDGRLRLRYVARIGDLVTLGVGAGATLPFGRTEEDPFLLAKEGDEHQHFQFGTGTIIPVASTEILIRKDRFGLQLWSSAQFSMYTNGKDFKPGSSVTWGIAPQVKIHPRVDLLAMFDGLHQAKDIWSGEQAPSSGKHRLNAGAMIGVTVHRGVWVYVQGSVPVWQRSLSIVQDDQILEPFTGSMGVSWALDTPIWGKKKAE